MTTLTTSIPPVAQVRQRLRKVRRTHSDRTLGELLTDVYLIAFLVVLYGGSASFSLRRHLAKPFAGPVGLESTRAWLIVAMAVLIGTLAWRGLRALGPLITTPAALSWCLSTPIDRAAWLRTPLTWLLVFGGLAGAVLGSLASWAGLSGTGVSLATGWAAVAGAGIGVALAGAAVTVQARPAPRRRGVRPSDVVLGAGVVLVAAAVATRVTRVRTGPPPVPAVVLAVVAVVLAGVGVWYARRSLPAVDRAALTGGAQLGAAAMTAAVMLDPALLFGLVEARRWRRPGKVHSRHLRGGSRDWVLFQADLLRLLRRPANVFVWAALLLAPYAVTVFSAAAASPVRIVGAYLASERLAAGLRLIARTPALRRSLGGTDWELKRAHLALPALGLAIWWTLTEWSVPAGTAPLLVLLLVFGVLGAVYRTATRPPMSYDAGLADTPLGPVPTLLLRRLLRGPDLVAVLVLIDLFL